MKKILIFLMLLILMSSIALGLVPCDEAGAVTTSGAFTDVVLDGNQNITIGGDEKFNAILNITPTDTFNFTDGYYENWTLVDANSTNSTLIWESIGESSVIIKNGTDGETLGDGNYTIYAADGIIFWHLSNTTYHGVGGLAKWNVSTVAVYYNKSFIASETDLVAIAQGYTEGSTPGFGGTKTWAIDRSELDGNNWTVAYNTITRTCTARDSCMTTRATIFAGFALIAVAIIVLSAFAIIKLISGEMSGAALGVLAVAIIGLAIIIMIGYYITSTVGTSICNAAVA